MKFKPVELVNALKCRNKFNSLFTYAMDKVKERNYINNGMFVKLTDNRRVAVSFNPSDENDDNIYLQFKILDKSNDPDRLKRCVVEDKRGIVTTTIKLSPEAYTSLVMIFFDLNRFYNKKLEKIEEENEECIYCAATEYAGVIYTGKHHGECVKKISEANGSVKERDMTLEKQGFLTTRGRFVDRKEAAKIALASGQIKRLRYFKDELDSADINYPDNEI